MSKITKNIIHPWPPEVQNRTGPLGTNSTQGSICQFQSSVAEWLGRWANLGVITTTELLGGRGFKSNSRHE